MTVGAGLVPTLGSFACPPRKTHTPGRPQGAPYVPIVTGSFVHPRILNQSPGAHKGRPYVPIITRLFIYHRITLPTPAHPYPPDQEGYPPKARCAPPDSDYSVLYSALFRRHL